MLVRKNNYCKLTTVETSPFREERGFLNKRIRRVWCLGCGTFFLKSWDEGRREGFTKKGRLGNL